MCGQCKSLSSTLKKTDCCRRCPATVTRWCHRARFRNTIRCSYNRLSPESCRRHPTQWLIRSRPARSRWDTHIYRLCLNTWSTLLSSRTLAKFNVSLLRLCSTQMANVNYRLPAMTTQRLHMTNRTETAPKYPRRRTTCSMCRASCRTHRVRPPPINRCHIYATNSRKSSPIDKVNRRPQMNSLIAPQSRWRVSFSFSSHFSPSTFTQT